MSCTQCVHRTPYSRRDEQREQNVHAFPFSSQLKNSIKPAQEMMNKSNVNEREKKSCGKRRASNASNSV